MESLAHTKWNCKYHIVFIPKYRRKSNILTFIKPLRKQCRTEPTSKDKGQSSNHF